MELGIVCGVCESLLYHRDDGPVVQIKYDLPLRTGVLHTVVERNVDGNGRPLPSSVLIFPLMSVVIKVIAS
jgi:hypothetical protein